jgi:hypothetical protein
MTDDQNGMLPSSNFFDGPEVMDLGAPGPSKPIMGHRRTEVSGSLLSNGETKTLNITRRKSSALKTTSTISPWCSKRMDA